MPLRGSGVNPDEEILTVDDEGSFRAAAGRSGAALLVVTGVLIDLAALVFHGSDFDIGTLWKVGAVALVVGGASLVVPWRRLPQAALVVFPVVGLLLLVQTASAVPAVGNNFTAFYVLAFAFLGLTQRRWVSVIIGMPVATAAYYLNADSQLDAFANIAYVVSVPAAALLGEALSYFTMRQRRAELGVQKLLKATMALNRVETEQLASEVLASLGAQLLEATEVNVCIIGSSASARYGFRKGQPVFLAKGFSSGVATDGRQLRSEQSHEMVFVRESDPKTLSERLRASVAREECSLYVPIPGQDGTVLGTMQAIWSARRTRLDDFTRQVVQVLCMEAGHVFERARAERRLVDEATIDPLTEVSNRRTFSHVLDRMEMGDAVVIVDLDLFKNVNDTYGHSVGDEVLRDLARAMKDAVRDIDCVARFGGEEFAMVLADAGRHGALSLVERLRRTWNASEPLATFSAGIAIFDGEASVEDIFKQADAALYVAKESGRNRTELHVPQTDQASGGSADPAL